MVMIVSWLQSRKDFLGHGTEERDPFCPTITTTTTTTKTTTTTTTKTTTTTTTTTS